MHIKQIIVKGFKTYKDQIVIGPLSPKDNVFVGLNGHGKSNFFQAIMFVLSDKFNNIRIQQKQRLIYQGDQPAQQALVQIILDNTDGRLPFQKQTISIKRHLRGDRDEYFLDGKHVTKTEINNLLQSASFSRSNPYYIVQQGRVASLASMNQIQTLELLKEVAGTKLYQEKRAESEKMLEETNRQRGKLAELMELVNGKLEELDQEGKELKKFTEVQKKLRALQYILYKQHLVDVQKDTENLEQSQRKLIHNSKEIKQKKTEVQQELEQGLVTEQALIKQIQNTQEIIHNVNIELSRKYQEKEMIQRQLFSQNEDKSHTTDWRLNAMEEIEAINQEYHNAVKHIENINPQYQQIHQKQTQILQLIQTNKKIKDRLLNKQGALVQFKNISQRNKFLTIEINEYFSLKEQVSQKLSHLQQEIQTSQNSKHILQTNLNTNSTQKTEKISALEWTVKKLSQIKQKRIALIEKTSQIKYQQQQLNNQIQVLKVQLNQAAKKVHRAFPYKFFNTLKKLKQACSHLPGFYGTVLDLIDIKKRFILMVDIMTGQKLFSIVVDSFETAKQVIQINKKLDGQSINIYPAQWFPQIKKKNRSYPSGKDTVVLKEKVSQKANCPVDLSLLLNLILGKTLLVQDLQAANRFSKDYQLNCVTLNREVVYSGGFLVQAGYMDPKKQRLKLYIQYTEANKKLVQATQKINQIIRQKDEFKSEDILLVRQQCQEELKKSTFTERLKYISQSIDSFQHQISQLDQVINGKVKIQNKIRLELQEIENSIQESISQRNSKQMGKLTEREQQNLNKAISQIQSQEKKFAQISKEKNKLQSNIEHSEMMVNLLPQKRQQIEHQLNNSEIIFLSHNIQDLEQEKANLISIIRKLDIQIRTSSQALSKQEHSLLDLRNRRKTLQQQLDSLSAEQQKFFIKTQKHNIQYSNLLQMRNNYIRKTSNIGSVSSDELEKYKKISSQSLVGLIQQTAKQLESFIHVNKRASDLHSRSLEKVENINQRLQQLNRAQQAIKSFMKYLTKVKQEAIIQTFRKISAAFGEVFSQLVHNGRGHLQMNKGHVQQIVTYTGINICVSFSNQQDTFYKMQSLSGGQKTVVAIALVIAIQRTDPAPFYLFDELDAALDTQYRASLAKVIQRSAEKAQFIMTTFKTELCSNASKTFEVKFQNRASIIRNIENEEAERIVSNEEQMQDQMEFLEIEIMI